MSHSDRIERLGGETVFEGKTFVARVERFRHADGEVVEREVVRRQDAAAIVVYDDEHVWLVRQPREALGRFMLEIPAGKLDVEGESPLETAKRELAEEIGREAEHWEDVIAYFPSSGQRTSSIRSSGSGSWSEIGSRPVARKTVTSSWANPGDV